MAKNTKPAIRFKGFTDDWEQRKLGEVAENFEYGLNAAAKEFDGVNKYIRITDIDDESHQFNKEDLTSPDTNLEIAERYKLEKGDILFARTGASVGKSYIYRESDGLVYYAGFLIRGKIKEGFDTEFVFQNTLTEEYKNYIRITSQRSGQPGVNAQEYQEYSFKVPHYAEQKQIGMLFKNLDNLITLHQRKYDSLVNVKKAMLEKMFPQNGETVPEIRFKGFTDAWEQRKLGEIAERVTRKNTELQSTLPLTISAQYGLVDQITYFNNRVASNNIKGYFLIKNGEFAYNKSSSDGYPFGAVKRLDYYSMGVLSTLYIVFSLKDNVSSQFLVSYYDTTNWHKEVAERAAEGARNHGLLNISADDFLDTRLQLPESLAEQEKIGILLKTIDRLITLHQRKLEKLKKMKKAMLEKMFV